MGGVDPTVAGLAMSAWCRRRSRARATGRRGPARPQPRTKQRDVVNVTAGLREYILQWHNRHRLQVALGNLTGQPSAANMKLLVNPSLLPSCLTASQMREVVQRWDEEIAVKSQEWAEACDYTHESDKHCGVGGFHSLGENIAVSTINFPGTMATDRDLFAMVKPSPA